MGSSRPRGEHCQAGLPPEPIIGSSPPARGTRDRRVSPAFIERFIPARAGNTKGRPVKHISQSVHPRPRGEHRRWTPTTPWKIGSSPPARGTPYETDTRPDLFRFIPARAGNTFRSVAATRLSAGHPRKVRLMGRGPVSAGRVSPVISGHAACATVPRSHVRWLGEPPPRRSDRVSPGGESGPPGAPGPSAASPDRCPTPSTRRARPATRTARLDAGRRHRHA